MTEIWGKKGMESGVCGGLCGFLDCWGPWIDVFVSLEDGLTRD